MSEYIDWQPDDSSVKVRVHRRVLAGIEHERAEEFRGVLLGSASPAAREVLVEDFAPLESGSDFRPIEDWFAGWNRHSLPAVGYFRAGMGDRARIVEDDRQLFAKYFPDKLNVLLLFQIRDGKAELAPVPAQVTPPGDTARPSGHSVSRTGGAPVERAERPGVDLAGPRAPLWEGDLAPRVGELAGRTQVPREERGARIDEPGEAESAMGEREMLGRPGVSPPAGDPFRQNAEADVPADLNRPRRSSRRYLAQAGAVAAGFLLGVGGYLAFRGDRPRQIVPPQAPPSSAAERGAEKRATAAPSGTSVATAPVTPASAARPSPFNGASEANRSVDPGRPASNRPETQRQIQAVITKWGDTLLDGDVAAHVNLYAPTVSPYFTKKSATRAQVRDDVRQMLARYGDMSVYKISDISVTPVDANNAFATFRKHWETENNKFSGEEREQLKLTRKGDDWLIAAEREVKVFWVKKK